MIVALDVGYQDAAGGTIGTCAVVGFETWQSAESAIELTVEIADVRPYVPGRLFERELPCLIAGLKALRATSAHTPLSCVVVDGNVRLDDRGRAGLGMHLFRELGESTPVVGVAKTPFDGLRAVEIVRGTSTKPLYVTAVGVAEDEAGRAVHSMAGDFRLPTLIKRADQLTRSK